MKKTFTMLMLALVCSAALTSCKKDYTCDCKVTVDFLGTPISVVEKTPIGKSTKKNAESTCTATETALKAEVGEDGTVECTATK